MEKRDMFISSSMEEWDEPILGGKIFQSGRLIKKPWPISSTNIFPEEMKL